MFYTTAGCSFECSKVSFYALSSQYCLTDPIVLNIHRRGGITAFFNRLEEVSTMGNKLLSYMMDGHAFQVFPEASLRAPQAKTMEGQIA